MAGMAACTLHSCMTKSPRPCHVTKVNGFFSDSVNSITTKRHRKGDRHAPNLPFG